MDVEGFETSVLKRASKVLGNPSLHSVLMELNGLGLRYGFYE
jgi:membrane-bound ClpP family serine protease